MSAAPILRELLVACRTCAHYQPATPWRPGVWEQRNGGMRFTPPVPATDAECASIGRHDGPVTTRADDDPESGSTLVILDPDRFFCALWTQRQP